MARSSTSPEAVGQQARYTGNLAETSLPEMLFKVYRFRVPGVLTANSGGVVHRVFVRAGEIVHARSTDLEASLGAYLRREGLLTPEAYEEVMRDRETSTRRLGVLVVERGLLAPDRVRDAIQGQIEAIVWSLFGWEKGSVEFTIGEWQDDDVIQIQLPIRRVIVGGIRKALAPAPLLARLGGRYTVLEPCYRLEDVVEVGLAADEFRLLTMVDGTRTLYDLCTEGPCGPHDNARLLWAFRVLELVRLAP
ncbi:MAG: DUF4388 domain-containing protein [Thermoanaerobaculia bacterium]